MKPYEDRGRHDGEAVSKGISGTRRVGPRKPYVPPIDLDANLARLTALLPRLTVDEQRDALKIIDARGRGYPNLGWRVDRYERLVNTPQLTGDALREQAAQDKRDLEGA